MGLPCFFHVVSTEGLRFTAAAAYEKSRHPCESTADKEIPHGRRRALPPPMPSTALHCCWDRVCLQPAQGAARRRRWPPPGDCHQGVCGDSPGTVSTATPERLSGGGAIILSRVIDERIQPRRGDLAPVAALSVAASTTTARLQQSWVRGLRVEEMKEDHTKAFSSPGARLQRRHSSKGCSALPRRKDRPQTNSTRDRRSRKRGQKRRPQPALRAGAAASPPQHARWTGKSGAPLLPPASFSTSSSVPPAPLNPV